MCLKLNACPERGARLEDIPDDIGAFGKLIAELFNFDRFKSKRAKKEGLKSKQADAVIKKIKEQQMQIKQEYDELVQSSSNKKRRW